MAQIEMEKRLLLDDGQLAKLIENAEFVEETQITDCYYDNPNFDLSMKDIWLKQRNGTFKIKLPTFQKSNISLANHYDEVSDPATMCKALNINFNGDLLADLKNCGYAPICTILTNRKKYRKDGFVIDVDTTDFGYRVVEIEKNIENQSDSKLVESEIATYFQNYGLDTTKNAKSKLAEYLFRNNKSHYDKLVELKVIAQS